MINLNKFISNRICFLGTFLISFTALCGAETNSKKPNRCLDFLLNVAAAILQLATAILIVGWIFSISWGMNFVNLASEYFLLNIVGGQLSSFPKTKKKRNRQN